MVAHKGRAPNKKVHREVLKVTLARSLILALITWRMRLITAKPRVLGDLTPAEFRAVEPKLRPLLQKTSRLARTSRPAFLTL